MRHPARAGRAPAARRVVRRRSLLPDALPHASGCARSEEHTSELQSPYDLVCPLLLVKKISGNERHGGREGGFSACVRGGNTPSVRGPSSGKTHRVLAWAMLIETRGGQ